jgi:hypothetical protein
LDSGPPLERQRDKTMSRCSSTGTAAPGKGPTGLQPVAAESSRWWTRSGKSRVTRTDRRDRKVNRPGKVGCSRVPGDERMWEVATNALYGHYDGTQTSGAWSIRPVFSPDKPCRSTTPFGGTQRRSHRARAASTRRGSTTCRVSGVALLPAGETVEDVVCPFDGAVEVQHRSAQRRAR